MYILQAFCALAIALLCTDVEAERYHCTGYQYRSYTSVKNADEVMEFNDDYFSSRKYTGAETVYFKVVAYSSPVTINNIKVAVESGNFLLSAESATSNICSGQTSECLGPKKIQEKVFFITVKPNLQFTNGQLTLELAQAGKIYLINREGARQFGNYAVRLYSGYHPVMFPQRLPKYKVTCNENCEISKIWGFGENFNIALARNPVKIWEDGCKDCLCTTERDGQEVFCKRGSSEKFNIEASSFYITLVPLKELKVVTDVEVTIQGGDFKSVEKLDDDTSTPYTFYQRKYSDPLLFKVTCASKCTIKNILVDGVENGGKFLLSAQSATTNICSGQTSECLATKQIDETEFFIEVKPNPSFTNGQLTVELGQTGKIYELSNEGARFASQSNVQVFSGYRPVKFSKLLPEYMITCDGNCKISEITGIGQDFKIAAAEGPVFVKKGGCDNCFCVSRKDRNNHEVCSEFNLGTSSFYITLVPDPEATNVWAHVKGSNFKGVTKINPNGNKMFDMSRYKGKPAKVYRYNGPVPKRLRLLFEAEIKVIYQRVRYHIEVLTDAGVRGVEATQINSYRKRSCTTRQACKSFDHPYVVGKYYGQKPWFRIIVNLRESSSKNPTYVVVRGTNLKKLKLVFTGRLIING